jgi:RNA polymerase sigma-70 factor, ECF subfamily
MTEIRGDEAFAALIESARRGERAAFDELFRASRSRLKSLVGFRMGYELRSRLEVDDVLQETFLAAFSSIGDFRGGGPVSFELWLARIAEHVIRRLRRYHAARKRCASREISLSDVLIVGPRQRRRRHPLEDSEVSPLELAEQTERMDHLYEAIERLAGDRRKVLILAHIRGLSLDEIAAAMHRGKAACSMLLLRAVRDLRESLAKQGRGDGASR